MDMQEPGDMGCRGWQEREPAAAERKLDMAAGLPEPANHIVISNRRAAYSV